MFTPGMNDILAWVVVGGGVGTLVILAVVEWVSFWDRKRLVKARKDFQQMAEEMRDT